MSWSIISRGIISASLESTSISLKSLKIHPILLLFINRRRKFFREQRDRRKQTAKNCTRNSLKIRISSKGVKNKEILLELDKILNLHVKIIKVTDFHNILDYYESVSKYEWHLKRDDTKMLRCYPNSDGLFLLTSKK